MPKDLAICLVMFIAFMAVAAIVTRKRLPGGMSVSAKRWKLLSAEYERLELEYNLAAQAAGTAPWWMDPAVKYGADDPMMRLASHNVDAESRASRRSGDTALGFFTGYSVGR